MPTDVPGDRHPDAAGPEVKVGGTTDRLLKSSAIPIPDRDGRHPWQ
jgi:hypothetical protein